MDIRTRLRFALDGMRDDLFRCLFWWHQQACRSRRYRAWRGGHWEWWPLRQRGLINGGIWFRRRFWPDQKPAYARWWAEPRIEDY